MNNFDLKKYLAEGKLLKEDVSKDVKEYLNSEFEIYLEGGDSFEEEPGETHVFTMEGDDERYADDYRFDRALNQLQQNPIVLDYNKDYVGDYGEVTVKADFNDIYISFIELSPLQQYVYNYEKEVSGEDNAKDFLDGIKKLNTPRDVYDYYAFERNWEGDSDLEGNLENIYNQVLDKFN